MAAQRIVAIYRADLLPLSETFIKKQLLALARWKPVLAGRRLLQPSLDLSGIDVRCLRGANDSALSRAFWSALRRLRLLHAAEGRAMRQLGASLVHVHFGVDGTDAWPSLRGLQLPVLVTLHGYDINIETRWWQAGNGGPQHRDYHQQLVAMAQDERVHFVAVSRAIQRRAVEVGIPADKVRVLHIGVDPREFKPAGLPIGQRPLRVLFVGRLVEKKGCEILIRAMAKVGRQVPNAELMVIGDGPLRAQCESLAAELHAPVRFLGSQSSAQVKAALDESRIFCLPSVRASDGDDEGLPIVVLEAQACGVPVVTSANGAREEGIADGLTGHAFAEGDHQALATLLAEMLADAQLLERMSRAAVEFIRKHFDIRDCTQRLEMHYDELVAAHSAQPALAAGR